MQGRRLRKLDRGQGGPNRNSLRRSSSRQDLRQRIGFLSALVQGCRSPDRRGSGTPLSGQRHERNLERRQPPRRLRRVVRHSIKTLVAEFATDYTEDKDKKKFSHG